MNQIINQHPCACGGGHPAVERDDKTGATWIECQSCFAVVGHKDADRATVAWNATVAALHAMRLAP